MSNAELARSAFVSRQSMNLVPRGLHERGLVSRPDQVPYGHARPTELTTAGHDLVPAASTAVREVEQRMLEPLSPARQRRLRDELVSCTAALKGPTNGIDH